MKVIKLSFMVTQYYFEEKVDTQRQLDEYHSIRKINIISQKWNTLFLLNTQLKTRLAT